ncbi:MAG: glycosyltransferase family 4 protein [Ilumatobacteraceae bacterium]
MRPDSAARESQGAYWSKRKIVVSPAALGTMEGVRVGYTLEQCWHRVPGGTAVAALEVAREIPNVRSDIFLVGVAGKHAAAPAAAFVPTCEVRHLPLAGGLLYESSLRLGWPRVERVVGHIDLLHCTSVIPFATRVPMIATVHDCAFLHYPQFFTHRGNSVFRRSIQVLKKRAAMVLCSSFATVNDCLELGFSPDRVRHVTLGVRAQRATADDIRRARETYSLPNDYLLFVGTLEPRKNLDRLVRALENRADAPPLVIAGATGWGDVNIRPDARVQFIGFVEEQYLPGLYAGARAMCYPSIWEGFGLPILEAMAQGTPVVTSSGTSTEEVANGAAVLVDPYDLESIWAGIQQALNNHDKLSELGRARAHAASWSHTAELTAHAYDEVLA